MDEAPPAETSAPLFIDWRPIGRNGSGTVTVQLGAETLAAERLDVLRPKQRADFIARLRRKRPDLRAHEIERELLKLAADAAKKTDPATGDVPTDEPHGLSIIRPEVFHTPEVSGLAVPVVRIVGSSPVGSWQLHLRWHADGRREQRALESCIDLPDGRRLWADPVPGEPSPSTPAAWAAGSRRAWLDGEPAAEPGDVFRMACELVAYYLDFPPEHAPGYTATLALWAMLTYCYSAWSAVPYLHLAGPASSGKTRVFELLARLVFRPLASSSMTAAALFRSLHDRGGTLLLDEAERLRDGSPEAGELRGVLLAGYKRGTPATRLEAVGDGYRQREFDVFGPKALAGIATLPEALASRCIRIGMFRSPPGSPKPRHRFDDRAGDFAELRDALHVLALEHGPTWLDLAGRSDVVPASFAGRDYELWQPLLALAAWLDDCGAVGLLGMMQTHAEACTESARDDATPEADEALLRELACAVVAGTAGQLKPGELLKRVSEADPATFAKWTPRGVSVALKRYGLAVVRRNGQRTFAGVTVEQLHRVAASYGIDLPLPRICGTTGTCGTEAAANAVNGACPEPLQ